MFCLLWKTNFLTESWTPILNFSSQRLLRPTHVTFLKTGCWNSNFQTSGIYRYLQTKSNLHISICQSHFKRDTSMWNTLYLRVSTPYLPSSGWLFNWENAHHKYNVPTYFTTNDLTSFFRFVDFSFSFTRTFRSISWLSLVQLFAEKLTQRLYFGTSYKI